MPIEITRRSLRQARLLARAPRVALVVACAVLTAAGLRNVLTLARAGSTAPSAQNHSSAATHQTQEALAEAFTHAYLTWNSRPPAARLSELAAYAPAVAEDLRSDQGSASRGHQS